MYSCTHWLRPRNSPLPRHLGSYTRALLVGHDRRHLFVTPCFAPSEKAVQRRPYITVFDSLCVCTDPAAWLPVLLLPRGGPGCAPGGGRCGPLAVRPQPHHGPQHGQGQQAGPQVGRRFRMSSLIEILQTKIFVSVRR